MMQHSRNGDLIWIKNQQQSMESFLTNLKLLILKVN